MCKIPTPRVPAAAGRLLLSKRFLKKRVAYQTVCSIIHSYMAKAIQLSIQEDLLAQVDRVTRSLHKTRSAVVAEALVRYLRWLETRTLERRHMDGYRKKPVRQDEFAGWEKEQVWPEA